MANKIRLMGRSLQTASKTITGSWEEVLWQGSLMGNGRDGAIIKNQDATLSIYGYIANGAGAGSNADDITSLLSSLTADDRLFEIGPLDYVAIHLSDDQELLICNSSGSGTTSKVGGREFQEALQ